MLNNIWINGFVVNFSNLAKMSLLSNMWLRTCNTNITLVFLSFSPENTCPIITSYMYISICHHWIYRGGEKSEASDLSPFPNGKSKFINIYIMKLQNIRPTHPNEWTIDGSAYVYVTSEERTWIVQERQLHIIIVIFRVYNRITDIHIV